jgi:trans-aconitate 2-methyltransferase
MSNFSEISKKYESDSVVQKSASDILFDLVDIQARDDVLDLGCGTGHISKLIKEKTKGKVVGVDPSVGMIKKAREKFSDQDISFRVCSAEQLDYQNEFDVIFCNSAFQWFTRPEIVLKACYRAFRNKGRMAIQAPAKDIYCPNFLKAIDEVRKHIETKEVFKGFNSPWFFRNTVEEYKEIFEAADFRVEKASIAEVITTHTIEEAYKIFESGAAAGYLNEKYYSKSITMSFVESFRNTVRLSFECQANKEGNINLTFYRIYLLAQKNEN